MVRIGARGAGGIDHISGGIPLKPTECIAELPTQFIFRKRYTGHAGSLDMFADKPPSDKSFVRLLGIRFCFHRP
jgi:hypothetical protein